MVAAGNRVFRGLHTIVPRGERSYFSEAMNRREPVCGEAYTLQLDGLFFVFFPPSPPPSCIDQLNRLLSVSSYTGKHAFFLGF